MAVLGCQKSLDAKIGKFLKKKAKGEHSIDHLDQLYLTLLVYRFTDMFGEALVEEFIDGTEVSVLAFEDLDGRPNKVLPPIQVSQDQWRSLKNVTYCIR